ncbi:hypothetical protein HON52_03815 [Candidatus Uhrbacteria bacterium]|jgi:hypothetical protein|nr:hypothetical protein [Candidatus Uhrbacteria bacterium]
MKRAFVWFMENKYVSEYARMLVEGEPAESREAFIKFYSELVPTEVVVISWFQVPDQWANVVGEGVVNDTLDAILPLDALGDNSAVSDLICTIFAAGYAQHGRDEGAMMKAFVRGAASTAKK